jgi:nicotinamide N-methyltransferase
MMYLIVSRHFIGYNTNGIALILADLLFNHSEHEKLVKSVKETLTRNQKAADSCALVFFTPYRPWLLEKDLDFFRVASEAGLVVEKIMEHVVDKVMFEEDPGVSYVSR